MLHQFGTYTDIEIKSYDVYKGKLRIIITREKYIYIKDPAAAFMGELTRAVVKKTDFFKIEYDIDKALYDNQIKMLKPKETLDVPNWKYKPYFIIGEKRLLAYYSSNSHENSNTLDIYDIRKNLLLKTLATDFPILGQNNHNPTKFYYIKSGKVYLYDIENLSEEVLPNYAFNFLKDKVKDKEPRATNIKNVLIHKNIDSLKGDEYILFNIDKNRIIKRLKIRNCDTIKDVFLKNNMILFLTNESWRGFTIRNSKSEMISRLRLEESYTYKYHIDNNKIYLIRFNDTTKFKRRSYGYIECIIWNYEKNEAKKLNFDLRWKDIK